MGYNYEKVKEYLEGLHISYKVVEHEPAYTTEEADKYIEGHEGVRTKTMFICNKKKTNYFMLIMDDSKRLDMKAFKEIISEKQIKMASEEALKQKLGIKPGMVSPFGLLNNEEKDVKIYIDKEIITEEIMTFHPNDNTKTLFISTKDLLKYFDNIGYEVNIIEL